MDYILIDYDNNGQSLAFGRATTSDDSNLAIFAYDTTLKKRLYFSSVDSELLSVIDALGWTSEVIV